MDSIKARVLALLLPVLGLVVSQSGLFSDGNANTEDTFHATHVTSVDSEGSAGWQTEFESSAATAEPGDSNFPRFITGGLQSPVMPKATMKRLPPEVTRLPAPETESDVLGAIRTDQWQDERDDLGPADSMTSVVVNNLPPAVVESDGLLEGNRFADGVAESVGAIRTTGPVSVVRLEDINDGIVDDTNEVNAGSATISRFEMPEPVAAAAEVDVVAPSSMAHAVPAVVETENGFNQDNSAKIEMAAASRPPTPIFDTHIAQDAPAGRSAWEVDIRNVEVDTRNESTSLPAPVHATADDKLLANKAVQMGFELVQRRANYSARARFVEALRIVSRSLDEQSFSTKHSASLQRALTAYKEAEDFFPSATRPDENVNLHVIVGGHDTPIMNDANAADLSPRRCVREYLAFAEQEFVRALGNEQFASQALYGLGRLESAIETTTTGSSDVRATRSLTLHQSALRISQDNYAAANELGVLLARYGQFENAVAALQHCVKISPQATAWKNLSQVYRRMGRDDDAQIAAMNAQKTLAAAPRAPFVATRPKVEWVDANQFASVPVMDANAQMAYRQTETERPAPETAKQNPSGRTARKSLFRAFGR